MFCPVCRYEFRRGFTKCNECGVDLVDTLPSKDVDTANAASDSPTPIVSPTLLWRGYDNSTFNDLRMTLDSDGIPYNREELDARMLYTDAYNPFEIWVPAANMPEAEKLRDEILSSIESSAAAPTSQLSSRDYELPSEDSEGPDDIRAENVTRELDSGEATAEAWAGADATTADMLKSCLAEIGIACYVAHLESGNFALRVLPEDEKRARDIVRQVIEGIPPQ
jgi:hypothetical protein